VPDPKSQVEQITIALIYKFMDDMDAEAEELGGSRNFFAGEYARYGWGKLMRSGLGGHETLNLYAEAIAKMPENPASRRSSATFSRTPILPYRDPETLRAFLKIIDEFAYDHSERLGDAFEYSALGARHAGRCRAVPHSAPHYRLHRRSRGPEEDRHRARPGLRYSGFSDLVLQTHPQANTDKDGNSTLTPTSAGGWPQNFKGYDISPDMVRLSLVNLYLHGFTDPHIFEYDTLTSRTAGTNTPTSFSPTRPSCPRRAASSRTTASRCRASAARCCSWITWPSTSHPTAAPASSCRGHHLPEPDRLHPTAQDAGGGIPRRRSFAPGGVFNPYFRSQDLDIDPRQVRWRNRTSSIAFFRIENDGFGLGPLNGGPLNKDDLPQARAEIAEYLHRLRAHEAVEDLKPTLGLLVPRARLAVTGTTT
jgi:type I restriction enzyme M protein